MGGLALRCLASLALGFCRALLRPNMLSSTPGAHHGCPQVLACDIDLLNPPAELEKRKHKLKRLVATPNSYFMDVKCQGCFTM